MTPFKSDPEKIENLSIKYKGHFSSVIEALEKSEEPKIFSNNRKAPTNKSFKDLQNLAKVLNIKGYSTWNKAKLLRMLRKQTQFQI